MHRQDRCAVLRRLRLFPLIIIAILCSFGCRESREPRILFDAKTGRVKIEYGTERFIDSVVSKPHLQSIEHAKLGKVWLVRFSRSDSCPSEYIALLPEGRTSEIFGNCNEFAEVRHEPEYLSLIFVEDAETERAAEKVNLQ